MAAVPSLLAVENGTVLDLRIVVRRRNRLALGTILSEATVVTCLHLDPSLPPEAILAVEELLLDGVEQGHPEVLYFWESPRPFVVLGYGQSADREADLDACRKSKIPVLRRESGGGAVLQGPGSLNYGLVLRQDSDPSLATVSGANRWIMERNARALQSLLPSSLLAAIRGHTDLALLDPAGHARKVSGNAQRRRRTSLLFHGTLLHSLDALQRAAPLELLRSPSLEPEYRAHRSHANFLTSIPANVDALRLAWTREWGGTAPGLPPEPGRIQERVASRYSLESWNLRR